MLGQLDLVKSRLNGILESMVDKEPPYIRERHRFFLGFTNLYVRNVCTTVTSIWQQSQSCSGNLNHKKKKKKLDKNRSVSDSTTQ